MAIQGPGSAAASHGNTPVTHLTVVISTPGQLHSLSPPSGGPPRPGFLLPGARHRRLPERRFCLLAVCLESSGHLQTGSGGMCLWAAPEPLRCSHTAVDAVPEASAPRLHGLLPSSQADPAVHAQRSFAALCAGAQGRDLEILTFRWASCVQTPVWFHSRQT